MKLWNLHWRGLQAVHAWGTKPEQNESITQFHFVCYHRLSAVGLLLRSPALSGGARSGKHRRESDVAHQLCPHFGCPTFDLENFLQVILMLLVILS